MLADQRGILNLFSAEGTVLHGGREDGSGKQRRRCRAFPGRFIQWPASSSFRRTTTVGDHRGLDTLMPTPRLGKSGLPHTTSRRPKSHLVRHRRRAHTPTGPGDSATAPRCQGLENDHSSLTHISRHLTVAARGSRKASPDDGRDRAWPARHLGRSRRADQPCSPYSPDSSSG